MNNTNNEFSSSEPKTENRFMVNFGAPFNIPAFAVYKTTRPIYIKSNKGAKWADMEFLLRDMIEPSVSFALMDGIRKLRKLDSDTIIITISILGPIGDQVEKWEVTGQIKSIDFGELDFNSDELLTITVSVNVHYAILQF